MLEFIFNPNNNFLWCNGTMWLYLGMISLVGINGYTIQNKYIAVNTKLMLIIPSFCILLFFSAFRITGADTLVYKEIFVTASRGEYNSFLIEPGFWMLNRILSFFTNTPHSIISLISLLTLFFVYKTLSFFRYSISIGIAIFAYVSIFYFQAYNLARMYLAASFLLYSFKYLYEDKQKKYALCILIAILFHYSAILMFFPFLMYKIYKRSKIFFYISVALIFLSSFIFFEYFHLFNIFYRYSAYFDMIETGSFGFGQIIFHLPFFILMFLFKEKLKPKPIYDLFIVFTISSMFFSFLAYKIFILGRMLVYYNVLLIVIVPYLIKHLKSIKSKYYKSYTIMFVCYIVFRCVIYFREYLFLDQIMPYKNILF